MKKVVIRTLSVIGFILGRTGSALVKAGTAVTKAAIKGLSDEK